MLPCSGGAYAEYVLVEAPLAMRVPASMPMDLAASIPEAWCGPWCLDSDEWV
jgi:NADPH:quinone reductase-like Zn-dependent oxidoreductase